MRFMPGVVWHVEFLVELKFQEYVNTKQCYCQKVMLHTTTTQ